MSQPAKNFFIRRTVTLSLVVMTSLYIFGCSDQKSAPQAYNNADKNESDIVGGKDIDYKSELAASVVFISSENQHGQNQVCTGTFITKDFILTAAHCISQDKDGMSVSFRGKDFTQTENITDIPIVEVFKLKFEELQLARNDLGIIQFNGGLPKGAKLALLPRSKMSVSSLPFSAVGYGRNTGVATDDPMASTGEGDLRYKKMTSETIDNLNDTFKVDQHKNNGGVCFGDSGGPAFTKDKKTGKLTVIGVASAVETSRVADGINPEDDCQNESLYLNMYFYADHIKNFLSTIVKKN